MAKCKIIIWSRKDASKKYPIYLRVLHLKLPATYIRLKGLYANTADEWDSSISRFTPSRKDFKKVNKIIAGIEDKADTIASSLESRGVFTYQQFKDKYLGIKSVNSSLLDAYKDKIEYLNSTGKEGTALAYINGQKAMLGYLNSNDIQFEDITYSMLKGFEQERRLLGNRGNTISNYLRILRALHYEYCKEADLPQPSIYAKFNIKRLEERAIKRGLNPKQLRAFIDYEPKPNTIESFAKDIFIFSFLTRGMNLQDIAKLTETNISDGKLYYQRSKTGGQFSIKITDEITNILSRYTGSYLFPIIKSNDGVRHQVKLINKTLNNSLKRIAKKIGLPSTFSFVWARHSYSDLARKNGVSIEVIGQALGHSSIKTTELYVKSFSNDELDSVTDLILNNI